MIEKFKQAKRDEGYEEKVVTHLRLKKLFIDYIIPAKDRVFETNEEECRVFIWIFFRWSKSLLFYLENEQKVFLTFDDGKGSRHVGEWKMTKWEAPS